MQAQDPFETAVTTLHLLEVAQDLRIAGGLILQPCIAINADTAPIPSCSLTPSELQLVA